MRRFTMPENAKEASVRIIARLRKMRGFGDDFMTLIECFTEAHIDNVAASLRLRPEKVIFVGDMEQMQKSIPRYEKVFMRRGLCPQVVMQDSSGMYFEALCRILNKIISEEDACTIDLTGGGEMVTMAIGAVIATLDAAKRKNVRVERFERNHSVVVDCINGNRSLSDMAMQISVAELVSLHGGCIRTGAYQPPKDCKSKELDGLWKVIADSPKDWNYAIMRLKEFESRSESKMRISLPMRVLRQSVSDYEEKEQTVRSLLDKLHRNGVIDDFSTRDKLEYTYRSDLLRYCTNKAGNVLEVKTLLEGRAAEENGAPYFHDCQMSVSLDWDGVVNGPGDHSPETRNEIDVVLMHGTTPLFISCKNGDIEDEELYKLNTVANRFGGPYAKKMLIATNLDRKSPAANLAFSQRTKDMGITLVEEAAELSGKKCEKRFKKEMQ